MGEQKPKQVSLAGAAAGAHKPKSADGKKKKPWVWIVMAVILIAIIVTLLFVARGCNAEGPSLTARETVGYTVTDDKLASDVSYFALGVLGEKSTDRMDMAAVMCFDREAEKISGMQMPVATYIGDDGTYATETLGDVWGNPQPIVWCDTCRKAIAAEEISGEKHTVCGTKPSTRTGSAFGDYIRVFNTQYGLPIDNYLVIPRDGLMTLIDAVGGVDIKLDETVTIDGIRYEKGVRTLAGKAAVMYAVEYGYKNTPDTDRARLMRQRQVFASLLDKLSGYDIDDLYNTDPLRVDVLSNVMLGRDPVRYDTTSFGKARLMGSSEGTAEGTKYIDALAEFVYDISHVGAKDVTFFTLPGVTQKRGTGSVYSVNKAQTVKLLGEYMNPYGLPLDDTTVTVPQLKQNQKDADAAVVTLDTVVARVATTENKESE